MVEGLETPYDSEYEKFVEFPKIYRISRECIVSEKIDGTNAAISITEDGRVFAQSRSRIITPENDNFGFARWVKENEDMLKPLGPGRHFGEWWGAGIQRTYGLKEKRFSLFNTTRWEGHLPEGIPSNVATVPVLYRGLFSQDAWEISLQTLRDVGSAAAPGFLKPEGIVVFHMQSHYLFKKTLEKDEEHKGTSK